MTECDGTWGSQRELQPDGPSGIFVQTCSGCKEILAIYHGRGYDFGPQTPDLQIVHHILTGQI
jgi:hypothetical protein